MTAQEAATTASATDALRLHDLTVISDPTASNEEARRSREGLDEAVQSARDLIELGGKPNFKAAERIVTQTARATNLSRDRVVQKVNSK